MNKIEKIIAEIERLKDCFILEKSKEGATQIDKVSLGGRIAVLEELLTFIDKTNEDQPEHSYFETVYKCGSKPRWKVGDTLAYYEFYSDLEGECLLGEVTDVKFDEEFDDWCYTFEDGNQDYEESLIRDEVYRKD